MEEREAVRVFKALGDEKRLRILSLLRQGNAVPVCSWNT